MASPASQGGDQVQAARGGVCSQLHHSAWIRAVCRALMAGQGCSLAGRIQTRLFQHTGEWGGTCKGPFWTQDQPLRATG